MLSRVEPGHAVKSQGPSSGAEGVVRPVRIERPLTPWEIRREPVDGMPANPYEWLTHTPRPRTQRPSSEGAAKSDSPGA